MRNTSTGRGPRPARANVGTGAGLMDRRGRGNEPARHFPPDEAATFKTPEGLHLDLEPYGEREVLYHQ